MRGAAPPKPTDLLTSIRVSGHIKLAKPKAQEDGYISKRKQILSGKFWFIKGKDSRGGCSLKSRQEASIKVFSIGTELVERRQRRAVNPIFCSREGDFVRTKWVWFQVIGIFPGAAIPLVTHLHLFLLLILLALLLISTIMFSFLPYWFKQLWVLGEKKKKMYWWDPLLQKEKKYTWKWQFTYDDLKLFKCMHICKSWAKAFYLSAIGGEVHEHEERNHLEAASFETTENQLGEQRIWQRIIV